MKRENERENERSERVEKAETKNNRRQREAVCPRKKEEQKTRQKFTLFHSRPIGGVWCASVVVRILILRITTTTTTIKASERCDSSQKRSRKKRKKEARQGRERFFVRNKRD